MINILYHYLYLLIMFFLYISNATNNFLKNINSKALRSDLNLELNKNYRYIPYKRTKQIFNEKINMIDI